MQKSSFRRTPADDPSRQIRHTPSRTETGVSQPEPNVEPRSTVDAPSSSGVTPKARASSRIVSPTKEQSVAPTKAQRDVGTPPADRLTLISFYVMMGALAAALVYLVAMLIFI